APGCSTISGFAGISDQGRVAPPGRHSRMTPSRYISCTRGAFPLCAVPPAGAPGGMTTAHAAPRAAPSTITTSHPSTEPRFTRSPPPCSLDTWHRTGFQRFRRGTARAGGPGHPPDDQHRQCAQRDADAVEAVVVPRGCPVHELERLRALVER